jgi:hypothetical protein
MSFGYSPVNSGFRNPRNLAPLGNAPGFSFVSKQPIASAISLLLRRRCPTAIILIVAVGIVYSIQCQSGWAFPHVRNEVFNQKPSFDYVYPPASISEIILRKRIVAPFYHTHPRSVSSHSRQSVNKFAACGQFGMKAPARLGISILERTPSNNLTGSAFANTVPLDNGTSGFPAPIWGARNNGKSPVNFTGQVNQLPLTTRIMSGKFKLSFIHTSFMVEVSGENGLNHRYFPRLNLHTPRNFASVNIRNLVFS